MRHSVYGRQLKRTKNERRRLFAGLVRDLFIHGRITTTVAKAKAVQPLVEKLITKAKEGSENSRRSVLATVTDKAVVKQLFGEADTRFANRTSGFTRIIKFGKRRGDASDTAMFSFVDERVVVETVPPKKVEKKAVKSPKAGKPKKSAAKKRVGKTAKKK